MIGSLMFFLFIMLFFPFLMKLLCSPQLLVSTVFFVLFVASQTKQGLMFLGELVVFLVICLLIHCVCSYSYNTPTVDEFQQLRRQRTGRNSFSAGNAGNSSQEKENNAGLPARIKEEEEKERLSNVVRQAYMKKPGTGNRTNPLRRSFRKSDTATHVSTADSGLRSYVEESMESGMADRTYRHSGILHPSFGKNNVWKRERRRRSIIRTGQRITE